MNLLVTVIGNAVVDSDFRSLLFKDPLDTAEKWGFHLTKGEVAMLEAIFVNDAPGLQKAFTKLEKIFYETLDKNLHEPKICPKPCKMSIYPPPGEIREARRRKLSPAA